MRPARARLVEKAPCARRAGNEADGDAHAFTILTETVYRTLEYLRGATGDDCRRLRSRGIQHTNQLLHRTSLAIDRERLSKKTGISPDRLLEFVHQCTMLEVSGMDRHLPTIRRMGIHTMKELRAQEPRELHARLVEAIGLAGAPTLSEVEYWISQATALDIVEEPEQAARRRVAT